MITTKSKMNISVITAAGLVIAAILVTYNLLSSPSYNTRHTALSYTQSENSSSTASAPNSSLFLQSSGTEASSEPPAESAASSSSPEQVSSAMSSVSSNPAGLININNANSEELQQIKRIGPTLAERIIEYRNLNGPFSSLDELLEVKGIGEKTLEIIKEYACV